MKDSMKKLYGYLKKESVKLIVLIVFTLIMVILTTYLPKLFTSAIDLMKDKEVVEINRVKSILVKGLIIAILAALLKWYTTNLSNKISINIARDLRIQCFKKINSVKIKFLDTTPHGEIVDRIIGEIDQISNGLSLALNQVFAGVFTVIFTIIFMLTINSTISLIIIIITPLSILITKLISKRIESLFIEQNKSKAKLTSFINEMTYNQKDSIAYNRQSKNIKKFNKLNVISMTDQEKAVFYSSIINPTTRLINNLVYALVVFVGAKYCLAGSLSIGGLACLITYIFQYTKPFNEISSVYTEVVSALTCIDRIEELLNEKEQKSNGTEELISTKGKITFENVSFSYTKKPFIEDITININPGEKVALVGPTGCGKTTLINLLMRFYKNKEGSIYIDDKNIKNIKLDSLRTHIGLVTQDPWILNGTIRDNLSLGNPKATDNQILDACKKTEIYSFIKRLPKGLDTEVSNTSVILSEGIKQLISITRVMISNPSILILDEATSSLDSATEQKVQNALELLMKNKTCFIVAHRLSTIISCDKIYVMTKGRIVEHGTHKELIDLNGFYETLYSSQY